MPTHTPDPGRPSWLPWSTFPLRSRFARLGGPLIHYVDEGSGPAPAAGERRAVGVHVP